MMALAAALLLTAEPNNAPACQRQTVIELFRLIATQVGTIADRARLLADQEENEWAMVDCALFPEPRSTPTPEQELVVRDAMVAHPDQHRSEILAYLKHVAPKAFAAPVSDAQVSRPHFTSGPSTAEYWVTVGKEVIRVGFDRGSCKAVYILFPDGRPMLGELDCLWRHKSTRKHGKKAAGREMVTPAEEGSSPEAR